MNNDEKILKLLESMQSDIKIVKDGQAELQRGQTVTNSRLEKITK